MDCKCTLILYLLFGWFLINLKAPELLDGRVNTYNEKSDVYGLGMVSYACSL
jgi:hypothetical protein